MMGDGRREMVKLSPLMYKRLKVSSCASRRHYLRARIVGNSWRAVVWKGLEVPDEHQVALVKRM